MFRIVFLLFLGSSFAHAEGSGKFVLEGIVPFTKAPEPVAGQEGRFEAEYNRGFELSDKFNFRFHPVARGTSAPESAESSAVLDPRELFLEMRTGSTGYFQLGYFTPTWEGTDGLNPMDIAAVRDNTDPLRASTLASAGLRSGVSAGDAELEVFWIPVQTRGRLPGNRSAWWPRRMTLPIRSEEFELRLPDKVEYERLSREQIDKALLNNVGARVQFRGDAWDLAVGGFEGAAETPAVRPVLNADLVETGEVEILMLRSPVQLAPVDYRRRTGSGFLTVTLGEWIFRVAARHDQPLGNDPRLPGWSQQGVAGVEKSFDVFGDQVTFLVQSSWGRHQDDGSLLSLTDLFDRAVLGGVRWPVGESWTIFLAGFRSMKDGSWFGQTEISRRWSDHFATELFVQILDGPPDSLPGILGDRDRAGVRLVSSF